MRLPSFTPPLGPLKSEYQLFAEGRVLSLQGKRLDEVRLTSPSSNRHVTRSLDEVKAALAAQQGDEIQLKGLTVSREAVEAFLQAVDTNGAHVASGAMSERGPQHARYYEDVPFQGASLFETATNLNGETAELAANRLIARSKNEHPVLLDEAKLEASTFRDRIVREKFWSLLSGVRTTRKLAAEPFQPHTQARFEKAANARLALDTLAQAVHENNLHALRREIASALQTRSIDHALYAKHALPLLQSANLANAELERLLKYEMGGETFALHAQAVELVFRLQQQESLEDVVASMGLRKDSEVALSTTFSRDHSSLLMDVLSGKSPMEAFDRMAGRSGPTVRDIFYADLAVKAAKADKLTPERAAWFETRLRDPAVLPSAVHSATKVLAGYADAPLARAELAKTLHSLRNTFPESLRPSVDEALAVAKLGAKENTRKVLERVEKPEVPQIELAKAKSDSKAEAILRDNFPDANRLRTAVEQFDPQSLSPDSTSNESPFAVLELAGALLNVRADVQAIGANESAKKIDEALRTLEARVSSGDGVLRVGPSLSRLIHGGEPPATLKQALDAGDDLEVLRRLARDLTKEETELLEDSLAREALTLPLALMVENRLHGGIVGRAYSGLRSVETRVWEMTGHEISRAFRAGADAVDARLSGAVDARLRALMGDALKALERNEGLPDSLSVGHEPRWIALSRNKEITLTPEQEISLRIPSGTSDAPEDLALELHRAVALENQRLLAHFETDLDIRPESADEVRVLANRAGFIPANVNVRLEKLAQNGDVEIVLGLLKDLQRESPSSTAIPELAERAFPMAYASAKRAHGNGITELAQEIYAQMKTALSSVQAYEAAWRAAEGSGDHELPLGTRPHVLTQEIASLLPSSERAVPISMDRFWSAS